MNRVQEFALSHGISNVLRYGSAEEKSVFARQCAETGYKRISTFFSDLSIAEWEGLTAVRDTYNNIVESWLDDYKMFTEFIICLNYKSWEWYSRGYAELSELYSELYDEARDKFYEHYAEDEVANDYFYEKTD